MTTLREAAQQALEALEAMQSYAAAERKGLRICDEAITNLRAALAQQDEPVGTAGLFTLAHLWAQQCYFKGLGRPCDIDSVRGAFEQALKAYTAPPQRLPLTEEEIERIGITHQSLRQVIRAIERAHGIKE